MENAEEFEPGKYEYAEATKLSLVRFRTFNPVSIVNLVATRSLEEAYEPSLLYPRMLLARY